MVIVTIIFVTYASIALIASTASAIANRISRKKGDNLFARFAHDLADLAAPSRGTILAVGVIPIITEVLIYAQLLQGVSVGVTTYLTISTVFFFFGFYFLYTYKKSWHLETIYTTFQDLASSHGGTLTREVTSDVASFERSASATKRRGGHRSAILLWIGTWIFVGTMRLAFSPRHWAHSTFLSVLFSGATIWSLFTYAVTAAAITSAAAVFFFFKWADRISMMAEPSYRAFVKRYALPVGVAAAAPAPLLIF
ncbi:MAG: hypothetical protein M1339_05645, partial [Bacteroidetes bacterium]|nr:hypothetical protein [Bacteroidota bacterium]